MLHIHYGKGAKSSFHYETSWVLKYGEEPETLGKYSLTQLLAKGVQTALSCQTLWACVGI